jgi:purine-binding chemotaxis protein CheW
MTATAIESPPLDSQAESQLVTFLLGEEEFGFDIMSVQEIIRVPKLARVPRTLDYVEGIANLRGAVLPIIDTRKRFGMERIDETDRTRVLIIDNNGVRTGLRVDQVKQVTRVSNSHIEPPPSIIKGISGDYLAGVVKLDQGKRIVMALNPAKVCQVGLCQIEAGEPDAVKKASSASHESVRHTDDVVQMVTFKLACEEFAFQIERVREILRVEEPKEVPDTPDYMLGVLTVRGKILPIIDLRCLLHQKSLADEMCAGVEQQSRAYRGGMETLKSVTATESNALPDTSFLESAKQWLNQFSSSSEALMESVGKLRNFNDSALRLVQTAIKLWASDHAGARNVLSRELAPLALQTGEGIDQLMGQIRTNIKEDQRIIVVDAGGMLLGLVVDHVNEVLNVAKNLIDPPPSMAGSANVELSGIAKLNDGARLIMLLDSGKLLADQAMQNLQQNAGDTQSSA